MHATEGWQNEAVRITAILFDGLRFGAQNADCASARRTDQAIAPPSRRLPLAGAHLGAGLQRADVSNHP
ncbi:hypothetical protein [Nonomuraea sp. NPDC049750]|uniref:hypothetical protein n=1 Tax=Nonomuraea sp. NPDC049750 TaxID=3154738 RepID=UPI0033C9F3CF